MEKLNLDLSKKIEKSLVNQFKKIDQIVLHNQNKVLSAFTNNKVALWHFNQSNGYGYNDAGKETLEKLFSDVFNTESAIVSTHILSGTHALSLVLFGLLRPNDCFLSISGKPYDTLTDVISGNGNGSLKDFNIDYFECGILNGCFDFDSIEKEIKKHKPKLVFMQRSKGYSNRNSFSINKLKSAIEFIKAIDKNIIVFVDNCYGEFTDCLEPTDVGADILAGSLIKNPGGGIAPNGGYIAGRKDLINLVCKRLTTPSTGNEIGSNMFGYQYFYQGLFLAPHTVGQSLKGALFLAKAMEEAGARVMPFSDCFDIINSIEFETENQLVEFCRLIQSVSPVDSHVTLYPWDMPGYDNKVIMAAGCFVQGSSIELSCDAPLKKPYIAYCQGGLTYEHIKIAALTVYNRFKLK